MSTSAVRRIIGPACESPSVAVALDEALAERVGRGESPPVLRIWETDRALVIPRSRSVRCRSIDVDGNHWPVCVRRSGGGVVAQGSGVINVSLIVPLQGRFEPSIRGAYTMWTSAVVGALNRVCDVTVEVGEVAGSFCAGAFDLSVGRRKLAGVAQMRFGRSAVIHGSILGDVDSGEYLRVIEVAERELLGYTSRIRFATAVSLGEIGIRARAVCAAIDMGVCSHPSHTELARAAELAFFGGGH